jgi:hypothetical protein
MKTVAVIMKIEVLGRMSGKWGGVPYLPLLLSSSFIATIETDATASNDGDLEWVKRSDGAQLVSR